MEEINQNLISSPLPSSPSSMYSISHSLSLLVLVYCPHSPLLHCFPVLHSVFAFLNVMLHTGPPPGLRNTPSICLPRFAVSSCFPNPVQKTRQLEARLAGGDPRRCNSLLRPRSIHMFDLKEYLRAGNTTSLHIRRVDWLFFPIYPVYQTLSLILLKSHHCQHYTC